MDMGSWLTENSKIRPMHGGLPQGNIEFSDTILKKKSSLFLAVHLPATIDFPCQI